MRFLEKSMFGVKTCFVVRVSSFLRGRLRQEGAVFRRFRRFCEVGGEVSTTFGRQKTRKTQKCETEGEGNADMRN